MRLRAGSRTPVWALAFLSPTIAEFMTGSTSVTTLFFDPFLFLVQLAFLLGLYGGGVLLIREFAVRLRKGWASILVLGAAYGIAEEGFAVHTFFQPHGSPVNALATYGAAFGVDWLWALAITVFHATYSIALPILIVRLWWPETRDERWLDPGWATLVGVAYFGTVAVFAFTTPHAPSPGTAALFLALEGLLVLFAVKAPANLLQLPSGSPRAGFAGLAVSGALGLIALLAVYFFSGSHLIPAWGTTAVFVAIDGLALVVALRRGGAEEIEWTEVAFATGMIGVLMLFSLLILPGDPAVAIVLVVMGVLTYRLHRRVARRGAAPHIPAGPLGI